MNIFEHLVKAVKRQAKKKSEYNLDSYGVTFNDLVKIIKDAQQNYQMQEKGEEYKGNEYEDTLEYPNAPTS
jgi:hypothetical protein